MPIRRLTTVLVLTAALLLTPGLIAQQPQVTNAQLSSEPGANLSQTLDNLRRASAPLWVAYVFPTEKPFTSSNDQAGVIYLERKDAGHNYRGGDYTHTTDQALLLMRIANGAVTSLRLAQTNDQFEAGGLRFVFLTAVQPEQSVAALKAIAIAAPGSQQRKDATFFISLHRSPTAVPTLAELAAPSHPPEVREAAAFWLTNQRGHEGFLAIQTLDRQDADPSFRRKLAFDLTVSHDPQALPELIRMAHEDSSSQVREQAQFWMSQQTSSAIRSGSNIAAELRVAVDTDPDAQSRKQAVFAISRLPAAQATPELARLLRTSRYPEVRQQAVFWLGQSHDPAALEVLTNLLQQSPGPAR